MSHEIIHQSSISPSTHLFIFPSNTHHSTDGLCVLCKLVVVLLLLLLHPPLHLLPLHSLFAGTEGRPSRSHLVHQAAQPPPVRTHSILFIVYHLRSWTGRKAVTLKWSYLSVFTDWDEGLVEDFLTHVAHSPHPASDELSFRHFDGQTQVRNTNVSCTRSKTCQSLKVHWIMRSYVVLQRLLFLSCAHKILNNSVICFSKMHKHKSNFLNESAVYLCDMFKTTQENYY